MFKSYSYYTIWRKKVNYWLNTLTGTYRNVAPMEWNMFHLKIPKWMTAQINDMSVTQQIQTITHYFGFKNLDKYSVGTNVGILCILFLIMFRLGSISPECFVTTISATHGKLLMRSWLEIQSVQQRVNWSAYCKYGGSLWLCKTHEQAHIHTQLK